MITISENKVVFSEVERMLHALHDGDKAYDDTVVVLGYNVATYLPSKLRREYPGKKLVVYQLEQLFDRSKWANKHTYTWLKNVDEIWEYDLSNLEWLKRNGFKPIYKPMEYCSALKEIDTTFKDIDILFYGYPTKRRLMIVGELMEKTWTAYSTVWATGVTGRNLQDLLGRSKIVLNVHAFLEDCRQEQVRIFYPVINGCCVVSEKSPHNEFGKSIVVCNTDKIAPTLKHVLDHELWKTVGESAPEVYRKHCEGRPKR